MHIYTIGFTKISAEDFFMKIKKSSSRILIDTRLNNTSQLSGFAKARDLKFFLEKICGVEYHHEPLLAPTPDMLKKYQKKQLTWSEYEELYNQLLKCRKIEKAIPATIFNDACLLCSEDKPHFCHRRLAAEYIKKTSTNETKIIHL